jgi:penicillin-binding protein 1C
LELTYSKNEVLALYASNAPFGTNVIGLDAASWRYFGRSPDKLSWGEMAAMAVLPNAPSLVHPGKNRQYLTCQTQQAAWNRLYKLGVIDSTTAALAQLRARARQTGAPAISLPPTFCSALKMIMQAKPDGDTRIRTSIRSSLQQQVNDILEQHHQFIKSQ